MEDLTKLSGLFQQEYDVKKWKAIAALIRQVREGLMDPTDAYQSALMLSANGKPDLNSDYAEKFILDLVLALYGAHRKVKSSSWDANLISEFGQFGRSVDDSVLIRDLSIPTTSRIRRIGSRWDQKEAARVAVLRIPANVLIEYNQLVRGVERGGKGGRLTSLGEARSFVINNGEQALLDVSARVGSKRAAIFAGVFVG